MILRNGKKTKVYNLPRGSGKSMRMLYASEFTSVPILCATNTTKDYLKDLAQRYGIKTPEPISVSDYVRDKAKYQKLLVDDGLCVLQEFLDRTEILGITLTDDNTGNQVAIWSEVGLDDVEVIG